MKAKVIKDPKYGFLRVDPTPSQEEVEEFYSKDFYDANQIYFNDSSLLIQEEQSDFFNFRWEEIFQECSNFFGDQIINKTLFDIGFGFAQALIYFKNKGLNVSGLEPSKEGVEYANKRGIKSFHTGIENFKVVNKKHDIVLLNTFKEYVDTSKVGIRSQKVRNR